MVVVGVDGCPGGWLAIRWDPQTGLVNHAYCESVSKVLSEFQDAAAIAIDIPIGLTHCAARTCDVEARRLIRPRHNSVFPAPDARIVCCSNYVSALVKSRELCDKGISKQAHAIFWRIEDANHVISPRLQEHVVEVHPELCFWALNSKAPLMFAKRRPEGFELRRLLLRDELGIDIPNSIELRRKYRPAEADDVLDAMAAVWTAHRLALGIEERIPEQPEFGVNGLRMGMVY